ncbi:MAG TPA: hypothetical protein VFA04_27795 [Bryobacteraceae bacterium]|nr:hypothetical protein [Bryobacteraceae bacterium]
MSRKFLWAAQVTILAAAAPGFGQNVHPEEVEPSQLKMISDHEARNALGHVTASFGTQSESTAAIRTGATGALPLSTYTIKAQNGATYSGMIVGGQPSGGSTTTVPTIVIPVILKITQGGRTYTFDPTVTDPGCIGTQTALQLTQSSPLFNNAGYTMNGVNVGITQYADAFLRGEFWTQASSGYHVLLSQSQGAALTISVNASRSGNTTAAVYSVSGTQCGTGTTTNPAAKLGVVNINTIDSLLRQYISAHGINASQFPFFVTYNAVMSNGAANNLNNCCILGYHEAEANPGQTYGIGEFEGRNQTVFSGVSDVSAISHEINEWTNDPNGSNPTPAWGNVGQVSGCQTNFEVGDPLSGTLMPTVTMGSFNYHLQELAFFSWFYGGTSIGAGGGYSSHGTFKGPAIACPPGGTN